MSRFDNMPPERESGKRPRAAGGVESRAAAAGILARPEEHAAGVESRAGESGVQLRPELEGHAEPPHGARQRRLKP